MWSSDFVITRMITDRIGLHSVLLQLLSAIIIKSTFSCRSLTTALSLHRGCRDGAVVRALASHRCGLGSIPRPAVKYGLSLLVRYSAPRGFLRVLRFPLSSKIKI